MISSKSSKHEVPSSASNTEESSLVTAGLSLAEERFEARFELLRLRTILAGRMLVGVYIADGIMEEGAEEASSLAV